MDVGEEVSSTCENEIKVSPSEEFSVAESLKKPGVAAPLTSIDEEIKRPEDDTTVEEDGKLNGNLTDDNTATPLTIDSNLDFDNVCEPISSSGSKDVVNEVADPSVTSSEPEDGIAKEIMAEEPQVLVVSSPSVSNAISACSPNEQIPTVTCARVVNIELPPDPVQQDKPAEEINKEAGFMMKETTNPTVSKEGLLLGEKLSPNSFITISRKEVKPETSTSEPLPEGRVLRLRPVPKPEPVKQISKPLPKPTESRKPSTSSSSSSADKSSSKSTNNKFIIIDKVKTQKRKYEDSEEEIFDRFQSSPIQYKGYKKLTSVREPVKKSIIKFNPFSPVFHREYSKGQFHASCTNFDSSSLQPEYAQYLGLQPLVKFRCNNCGMSSFQTMNALNAHKTDCNKSVSSAEQQVKVPSSTDQLIDSLQSEPKSANIKLTRKVFLCSACGTYYELSNLFLHMREAHRRYICLKCLGMSSTPEKLSEHLKQKHGVVCQTFDDPDKFAASSILPEAFYLMCVNCNEIYSEDDNFGSHKCPGKKSEVDIPVTTKNPVVSSQTQTIEVIKAIPEVVQPVPSSSVKQVTRRTRESFKKLLSPKLAPTKALQPAKKEEVRKATPLKEVEESSNESLDQIVVPEDTMVIHDPMNIEASIVSDGAPPTPKTSFVENNPDQAHKPVSPSKPSSADLQFSYPRTPSPTTIEVAETLNAVKDRILQEFAEGQPRNLNERPPGEMLQSAEAMATESVPAVAGPEMTVPEEPFVSHPAVSTPISLSGAKTKKRGARKTGGRRKRSLTLKPRKPRPPKPKKIPVPYHPPVNSSGLLPNPLNSINFPTDFSDANDPFKLSNISEVHKDSRSASVPLDYLSSPNKSSIPSNILKKLNQNVDSDADSDDSQKLSLVVDESANNSDAETKSVDRRDGYENDSKTTIGPLGDIQGKSTGGDWMEGNGNEIPLAGEDIQPMALALDDKIGSIPIQAVLKECVRTSCSSCNYCRHAYKIAVNGKYLALHLLSEHRYMPIKNEKPEDVISKLKDSLVDLENMFFNTETYDNTDPSIHVPHDRVSTFDCFQCSYFFNTHKDLFTHKRKFHTKPLLLCIMCKTNFFSYSEMLCHLCPGHYKAEIMFHNVHINFRCCFCKMDNIPSAFRLMVHLRKTHHACDICLEVCSDQQKLSTHLWKHKVNHLCYRCGISYASKPDITKHLFWKHGHESVLCKKCLQKKWPHVYHFCIPPTSFICEECSASFSKAIALKVHKRLHSQEFPYACSECDKKFISKKLLKRHDERHRNIELNTNGLNNNCVINTDDDQKDEIINVTDVVDFKDEVEVVGEDGKDRKDDLKEKAHKKHKKDKKDKVADLYDLPPLNLSSESDSSDDDQIDKKPKELDKSQDQSNDTQGVDLNVENSEHASEPENDALTGETKSDLPEPEDVPVPSSVTNEQLSDDDKIIKPEEPEEVFAVMKDVGEKTNEKKPVANEIIPPVEGIWENFYKTNPKNRNLPFPLCAMKSEVAYGIIMGDHDYCVQAKNDPVIKDDLPSSSILDSGFINDNLDEINVGNDKSSDNDKKKTKSPKKKSKPPNENSSSSSESSSDSDSTSCTCGTNCSCSSSTSNSSSSSSSDSDSSAGEDKAKQERKRKKKERKSKTRTEVLHEVVKEEEKIPEAESVPPVPVDPPIQESELETDESSTDEEFYDQQPGRIANQFIAEKRNQLIMSVAPPNNGNVIDLPQVNTLHLENTPMPKPRARAEKKRRRTTPKSKSGTRRPRLPVQSPLFNQFPDNVSPYSGTPGALPSRPLPPHDNPDSSAYTPTSTNSTPFNSGLPSSAASSDDKSRASKRRRIPNKFYGYSSGDEDEQRPLQAPKWRKQQDLTPSIPRMASLPQHPSPTPRIQLTVPKQVIRKPSYHKSQKTPKITIAPPPLQPPIPVVPLPPPPHDFSDTDSDTDVDRQQPQMFVPPPPAPAPLPPPPLPPSNVPTSSSNKPEKDVYCYCRCPYDEVSEMIACDDETCPIEWFHFECVGILVPPRGQWYCPGCRKARGLPN